MVPPLLAAQERCAYAKQPLLQCAVLGIKYLYLMRPPCVPLLLAAKGLHISLGSPNPRHTWDSRIVRMARYRLAGYIPKQSYISSKSQCGVGVLAVSPSFPLLMVVTRMVVEPSRTSL